MNLRLTLILTLLTGGSAYGQLINNDPYNLDYLIYLDFELPKEEIIQNKIKSLTSITYKTQDNKPVGKGLSNYKIDFNSAGNPVTYFYVYRPTAKSKKSIDYFFTYDSLNRLTKLKEVIKEVDYAHSENDATYFYDNNNRVIKTTFSRKYLYKPGYKYRGVTYQNDTSVTETQLLYDDKSIVTTLITKSYQSGNNTIHYDTAFANTTYDSLFISKTPKPNTGSTLDSLNRVIEQVKYRTTSTAKTIGGECIIHQVATGSVYKYNYDNANRLLSISEINDKNELVNTTTFNYDTNGLLQSRQVGNSGLLTIYKYDK